VWVNQYNVLNNNVPFGGKKQSGIGESLLTVLFTCSALFRYFASISSLVAIPDEI